MKNLFIKSKSRLGLITKPKGESESNIGVEEAPDYILDKEFLASMDNFEVIDFIAVEPKEENYLEIVSQEYSKLIMLISDNIDLSTRLINVGGDHSVAFASLASILKIHNPLKTEVIMIDSHADLHQPSTSPSGNFHGMWLRPIIDKYEYNAIDELSQNKLPVENLIYIGNLDIEEEEIRFIKENNIANFNNENLNTLDIDKLLKDKEHLHISFDIDSFSYKYAPATGMKVVNGFTPDQIFPVLEKLSKFKSISLDLVEVNPKKKGVEKTVKLAKEIIKLFGD